MAISDQERIEIDHRYTILANTDRGLKIRKMLESHPVIKTATGKQWLNPLVYHPATTFIDGIILWYMWFEDRNSPDKAVDALKFYLEHESVKTTFCVWVFGIKPNKIHKFGDVSLIPVKDMPDSRERDEYLALRSNLQSPVAHAAFTIEKDLPRTVENKAEASKIHSTVMQPAWKHLSDVAALVNGVSGLSCLPHWSCAYLEPHLPFGPWTVGGKHGAGSDIVGTHSRDFSDDNSRAMGELINNYNRIQNDQKKWSRFSVILERIRSSKRQQATEGKILDLGIAVEMLLLNEFTENDPISLPFRLRGSWLLGSDPTSRQEIYETLKMLYSYRCQIAHSGSFTKEKYRKNACDELPEFYRIVEKILRLALCPEYPERSEQWTELLLGGKSQGDAL